MKVIFFTMAVLILFLSGCAVINTSMMETAETVKPGHPKFGIEHGYGLDLTSTMIIANAPSSSNFDATTLRSLPVYGMKTGIGLTDKMDINGKIWVCLEGVGFKLYVKYRLPMDSENTSIAVAPSLTFVATETSDDDNFIANIESYGFEIPFLATYRVGKVLPLPEWQDIVQMLLK